jgi:hypothetical protein
MEHIEGTAGLAWLVSFSGRHKNSCFNSKVWLLVAGKDSQLPSGLAETFEEGFGEGIRKDHDGSLAVSVSLMSQHDSLYLE